jgi:uncharacterized protein YecT (DUF1311 family)
MAVMQSQRAVRFRLVLTVTCLVLSNHSMAQHMNAPDAPCQAPASNAETTACFISASKAADAELNKAYLRIREVLSGDERKDLQEAQRLWVKFRDATCSAEHNLYTGGSAAPGVYAACIEEETRHRTADLKTIYGWRLQKFGKAID